MTNTNSLKLVIGIILLASSSGLSQIASTDAQACNPKTAQMLVEQQVLESKSVVERPKRVKILLRAADFLWPLDQPTARSYFVEAFTNAKEHFAEKGFESENLARSGTGTAKVFTQLPDLRNDVIRAVSKRDPDLAKKFTEEILADYDKAKASRDETNDDREQADLMMLAAENADTNPEFSRYLFRRLIKYPLIENWFWTLYSTARKNQSLADSVYSEALASYRNATPRRLLFLSAYPFGNVRVFGHDVRSNTANVPAGFAPNPPLQRAFLNTFFDRVISFAGNADDINRPPDKYASPEPVYMVSALREIEPVVIQRFPELLERFAVARSAANSLMTEEMRKDAPTDEKSGQTAAATFDERIKQLEEAEVKGTLTDSMVAKIIYPGVIRKEEQYKTYESWIPKIRDEKTRADLTGYFWYLRSKLAITELRFADAERMAQKIPEIDHRSIVLLEIATKQLDSQYDSGSAFGTLNGVSKVAHSAPNSVAKAQVLFNLVPFYERLNHSVALDELGEAIRTVNQLENPNLFDNWIYRQIVGKDFAFVASLSLPGGNFEGLFSEIGKKDFELSLANARTFDDKYFRTIAVLAVAKNCVQVKPVAPAKKPK